MSQEKKYPVSVQVKRVLSYVFGLFLMATGVSLSIQTSLGVAPVSSVSLTLGNVLGVEVGNMTILVFSAFVLAEFLLLRRDFRWIQLLQIPCAVIFGKFVTLTGVLFNGISPVSLVSRVLLLLLAALCCGAGVLCYLTARLIPQAADGLVEILARRLKLSLSAMKNYFDLSCVAFSTAVSLLFFRRLVGVGLGTVIMAVCVGRSLWLCTKLFGKALERFIYEEHAE